MDSFPSFVVLFHQVSSLVKMYAAINTGDNSKGNFLGHILPSEAYDAHQPPDERRLLACVLNVGYVQKRIKMQSWAADPPFFVGWCEAIALFRAQLKAVSVIIKWTSWFRRGNCLFFEEPAAANIMWCYSRSQWGIRIWECFIDLYHRIWTLASWRWCTVQFNSWPYHRGRWAYPRVLLQLGATNRMQHNPH